MKAKLQQFYQAHVRAFKARLAGFKARALVWLTRHSVLFNKVYPTQPKRRFTVMKAKLFNFYLDRIQPLLDAAKAKLTIVKAKLVQLKERLPAWLGRRRWWTRLGLVVASLTLVLFLHWPTFSPYRHVLGKLAMLPPGAALLYFLALLVPAQFRQQMIVWFNRRRQGLKMAAGMAIALAAGATLTYLWLTSPVLQAVVQGGLVHVSLFLAGLWAFVKTPLQTSRPVLVTPRPHIQDEMPVTAGDGRLV